MKCCAGTSAGLTAGRATAVALCDRRAAASETGDALAGCGEKIDEATGGGLPRDAGGVGVRTPVNNFE